MSRTLLKTLQTEEWGGGGGGGGGVKSNNIGSGRGIVALSSSWLAFSVDHLWLTDPLWRLRVVHVRCGSPSLLAFFS